MDEEVSSVGRPALGEVITPAYAMRLAIEEGKKGRGSVAPNPLVGCVIVDRDHRFLSVGYHAKLGGDHAEIHALKQLPSQDVLQGSHLYVSLEPCAHQGRTPSCAKTLAPLKPASLTYAVQDPNPLVAGQGAKILQEAGVQAQALASRSDISAEEKKDLIEAAEDLAEIFLHNHRANEPFVAVKTASSLDGKIAYESGESKWITGDRAREHVHVLRATYDAVLVGRHTFEYDDPSLNVRHRDYPNLVNKAVILDGTLKSAAKLVGSKLLQVRPANHVFVVTARGSEKSESAQRLLKAGVKVVPVSTNGIGVFNSKELLQALKAEGLSSLMVEGGGHAISLFFKAHKVQRLHAFVAPLLMGGAHTKGWSDHFGGRTMQENVRLERVSHQAFGEDLYWSGRVRY